MRAKKIDGNQNEIVSKLRKIPGVSVAITSMVGNGFPDLIVAVRDKSFLVELKDPSQPPSKRRLTPDEEKFKNEWTGGYHVCETFDEILKIIS